MRNQADLHRSRLIASVAATLIALACGTNYVYSAWSPQFAERLKLSSTQSNLVGLFGNLGMYTMGVPIGMFVDHRGPRPAVLAGSITLAAGYFPLHEAYDRAAGSIPLLCFFSYLTGAGGCMAFAAAVKTSALNWPDHRGTATAFPLAAFGLSAFFFSFLGSLLFHGDPSRFLMLLAAGTCGLTFVGFFFLKVYPHPQHAHYSSVPGADELDVEDEEIDAGDELHSHQGPSSEQPSPPRLTPFTEAKRRSLPEPGTSSNDHHHHHHSLHHHSPPAELTASSGGEAADDMITPDETSTLLSTDSRGPKTAADDPDPPLDVDKTHHPDIRGFALLRNFDFWKLFLLMALLAGVGLMTINNIGNDAKALWEAYDPSVSDDFLVLRQQMHVSILSVCSFLGRLGSGVGSDWLVRNLGANRLWCLVLAILVFLFAQLSALTISNPHLLVIVSSLSGLGYGFTFGVFPSIVSESFGMRGFSQNWGFMTLAPVLSGNVFNLFYGSTYDRHSIPKPGGGQVCMDGLECYRAAYLMTLVACGLGVFASLWVIRQQHVRRLREESKGDLER